MNQKLKKRIVKNIAIVFSAVAVFLATFSNTFYAVKHNNEAPTNADQEKLDKQLLDLAYSVHLNLCKEGPRRATGYKSLIDGGADVNAKNFLGYTPLHYAAEGGDFDFCKALLEAGADVNARDCDNKTPLMCALDYWFHYLYYKKSEPFSDIIKGEAEGNVKLIELLLNSGADVNAQDNFGRTPLLNAIQVRHELAFELILKNEKVDVNLKDNNKMTALHYAVKYGNIKMCEDLVKKGARFDESIIKFTLNFGKEATSFNFSEFTYDKYIKLIELFRSKLPS